MIIAAGKCKGGVSFYALCDIFDIFNMINQRNQRLSRRKTKTVFK